MKTVDQMREEINALMKQVGDLQGQLVAERREPTEEEVRTVNGALARVKQLEGLVRLQSDIQSTSQRLKKPVEECPVKPEPEENRSLHITGGTSREAKRPFLSMGEFFQAVIRAGMPSGEMDQRLLELRAISGMGTTVPADGGFLVQQDFSNQLIEQAYQASVIAQRCQRDSLSSNANGMVLHGIDETSRADDSRFGGISMSWLDEGGLKSASKPSIYRVELKLKKIAGVVYLTDELLQDAGMLSTYVPRLFRMEAAFRLDDAIINGNGAGQPMGIMNGGCLVTVAAETGQAAASLDVNNLVKMWSRMWAGSRANSVWLIEQSVEPQLFTLGITVGTGGSPIYMPPGGLSQSPYGTLFGRPVIPVEQCKAIGTTGDVLLCDFSQYQLIDKGGMQSDTSIHVRFLYDETALRFVYRVDGMPLWKSSKTAKAGTYTRSPFVALATRT